MKRGKKKIFQISKYSNFFPERKSYCEVNKIFFETELFWRIDAVQLKLLVRFTLTFSFSTLFFQMKTHLWYVLQISIISNICQTLNYFCWMISYCYSPQRSCEGYVFTSVCLSTGVGSPTGGAWSRGMPGPWGVPGPGGCLVWGGSAPRGCLGLGGCLVLGGWYPSMHWGRPPQEMATAADGMHPTGMHSCWIYVIAEYSIVLRLNLPALNCAAQCGIQCRIYTVKF